MRVLVQMCADVDADSALSSCTCAERFLPDTEGLAHVMHHDLICQLCDWPVWCECNHDSMLNHNIILTETFASSCRIKCCHSMWCIETAYLMKLSIVSMTQLELQ